MDVAADRMNCLHATSLRLLKDMRERSALREMSKKEAKAHLAAEAAQHASRELAIAQQHCARAEMELYQRFASLDALSIQTLDQGHLHIERLEAKVASRRKTLDNACIAQEQTETAASEARSHWISCSAARHKWQQIEDDVRRGVDIHSQTAAETEADDEILLRYASVSLTEVAGKSI
ncbi:hypothetical protein RFM99_35190 [Mesorhizobium sp. VK4C]|uniref:hypothetical protein n=1 Tax=Mesorhizobium captivum TaxID=3072319 RepID=UPI002A243105|nr:hypothetical protein [Mesorhizobium sp. VK4C]MDX8503601.1 hypothetical protein [Mesorhizobium sp. VK4C]